MKNRLFIFILLIIGVTMFSCEKDYVTRDEFNNLQEQVDGKTNTNIRVKYFNITFSGGNSSEVYYSGIHDEFYITEDVVVLIYIYTGANSANTVYYWSPLPYSLEHGGFYSYEIGSTGLLYIKRSAGEGYTFDPGTISFKALIIDKIVYLNNMKKGVNHSDYEQVKKAYGLQDDNLSQYHPVTQ